LWPGVSAMMNLRRVVEKYRYATSIVIPCSRSARSPSVSRARLVRASPRRRDTSATWEEQARAVAPQPPVPTMTAAVLGVRQRLAHGRLPWVATVSGFVVFGGEATGWSRSEDGASVVDLERPGRWYRDVAERWFAFGRGRHWCFWDPWRCVTSGPDHGSSGGLATMSFLTGPGPLGRRHSLTDSVSVIGPLASSRQR